MSTVSRCLDCKHAEWLRTDAGRLHPSGQGQCSWTQTFQVAASTDRGFDPRGTPVEMHGGYIYRHGGSVIKKCAVYQRRGA